MCLLVCGKSAEGSTKCQEHKAPKKKGQTKKSITNFPAERKKGKWKPDQSKAVMQNPQMTAEKARRQASNNKSRLAIANRKS